MKTYNVFRKGDIAFEGHKSKDYSYGRFVENDIGDGIVSHVFDVFRPKTEYGLFFWKYLINNENVMGHVLRRVTTKATMMNNLVAKDFLKASVQVPTFEEQTKIGQLFHTLDRQIALHQRNFELLKEQKKGYLQKMFPKNGSKFPQLRFRGFADPWEQRKFFQLTKSFSGLTYSPKDIQESGTLVLRSSNIQNDDIVDADNVFVNNDVVNCDNVQKNDVIVVVRNGSRNLIGKHALVRSEMINTVVGAFMTGLHGNNGPFINALLSTSAFKSEVHKSLGATINQITGRDFKLMKFYSPEIQEQDAIGQLFLKLDSLIAANQRKVEKLQELKKGYLQKMFC